ncbi:MAG: hypothetical protein HFG02_08515 [Oscillibacter sp.]|nr:hypothetical protein [Oscillibacter sp.]
MEHLEISKIMDEYTDTEFFPVGASDVDPEAVKARVLAGIKAPTMRKRMSQKKKLLLAAGLAAALVLMGAGLPSLVHQAYRLLNTTLTFEQNPDSKSVTYEHGASSIEVEDGRLFFVLDEERTDITDFISDDTPYIYDGSDPETGLTYYLIMGGTPENYGWLEWVKVPNPYMAEDGDPTPVLDQNGRLTSYNLCTFLYNEESGEYDSGPGATGLGELDWAYMEDFLWLIAGAKQLGLPFVDSDSGTNDVFYLS